MLSNFDLKGKVAVITGGTGILGSSIALSLSNSGVKIVILGRSIEKIETVKWLCHYFISFWRDNG